MSNSNVAVAVRGTTVRGTIAQLAGKIFIGGKPASQPFLSMLTDAGYGKDCGLEAPTGKRGRRATVWEFSKTLRLEVDTSRALTVTANESAPAIVDGAAPAKAPRKSKAAATAN